MFDALEWYHFVLFGVGVVCIVAYFIVKKSQKQ